MIKVATALFLLALGSRASATTVTLSLADAADHVNVVVDSASQVTIALAGGQQWDWLKVGSSSGANVPTVPPIGENSDGVTAAAITITGSVTAIGDVDPGDFAGASATVNGVAKVLVQSGATECAHLGRVLRRQRH